MSLNEVDSHQRKCSILSIQVSLSDRCLHSDACSSSAAACGPNVKSTMDFSTAFAVHRENTMWSHRGVNITQTECEGPWSDSRIMSDVLSFPCSQGRRDQAYY